MKNKTKSQKKGGTRAEAQCHHAPAASSSDSGISKGALPSNTAPANYNELLTQIFRTGVDSLYLSWSGTLSQEYDELLVNLKTKAQSANPKEQSEATLQIFGHRFEVLDKGRGLSHLSSKIIGITYNFQDPTLLRCPWLRLRSVARF